MVRTWSWSPPWFERMTNSLMAAPYGTVAFAGRRSLPRRDCLAPIEPNFLPKLRLARPTQFVAEEGDVTYEVGLVAAVQCFGVVEVVLVLRRAARCSFRLIGTAKHRGTRASVAAAHQQLTAANAFAEAPGACPRSGGLKRTKVEISPTGVSGRCDVKTCKRRRIRAPE